MPAKGMGRRHLSLGGPATTGVPGPGGVFGAQPRPGRRGLGSAQVSPRGPRAVRRESEPRPFPRSGPPAPSAQWLRPAGPVASGRVPSRRARGAGSSGPSRRRRRLRGVGTDPERRARPPRTHRASLAASSALLSLLPSPLPRLRGRPHWALGLGRVRCRGWTRTGTAWRGSPESGCGH